MNEETIYVGIPSYCDTLLLATIYNMQLTADFPERLHFGVCYQDDDLVTLEKLKKIDNCRIVHIAKKDARGVGYAQHILDTLYDGEDYVLFTESHIRCVKGWDTRMTRMLNKCGRKAVLTNFCHHFDDTDDYTQAMPLRKGWSIKIDGVTPDGHLGIAMNEIINSDHPELGAFIMGQVVFARGQLIKDVPHDPQAYMNDAESDYTVRVWTHGYDIYYCCDSCFYHKYEDVTADGMSKIPSTRAEINKQERLDKALQRLRALVGIEENKDIDFGEYGLGTERTIESYERFAGVDYKKHITMPSSLNILHRTENCFLYDNQDGYNEELKSFISDIRGYKEDKTIAVGIHSYDDRSLIPTVQNMIYTAAEPKRLHFIIYYYGSDRETIKFLSSFRKCTVIWLSDYGNRTVGYALNRIEELICSRLSCDYFLLTEGHIRCSENWDSALIKMYDSYGGKHVLTAYSDSAPDYLSLIDYRVKLPIKNGYTIEATGIDENGCITAAFGKPAMSASGDDLSCLVALNCIFGETACIREVRHDPEMELQCNETDYSLRLFTHGYDVRSMPYIYLHLCCGMVTNYIDFTENIAHSAQKLRNILGMNGTLCAESLGNERSIAEFKKKFGLSFDIN